MKLFCLCMGHSQLYLQVINGVKCFFSTKYRVGDIYKVIHNWQIVGDNYTVSAGFMV